VSFKLAVLALAGLLAAPLAAQETGPNGLAEPHYRGQIANPLAPPPPATPDNILNLQLSDGGTVSVQLRPDKAPLSVERIKTLVGRHFYDGLSFHRVIDGFMAQGGDPNGDGSGGSDLPDLKAEFNDLPHVRGAMAMARANAPDSANSQFYLMLSPDLTLDNNYTVIGRVIGGMAYVDAIEKGEPPANPTKIVRAWIGAAPANPAGPVVAAAVPPAPPAAAAEAAPADAPAAAVATPARRRRPR